MEGVSSGDLQHMIEQFDSNYTFKFHLNFNDEYYVPLIILMMNIMCP